MFAEIIGTGHCLPKQSVSNQDLEQTCNTTSQWIEGRTGIKHRHIASSHETTSALAEKASLNALDDSGVSPGEIDLIILGTTTPEKLFPATACLLQSKLGADNAFAFDVQAVCSGFIYALSIAEKYILTGKARTVLVVGADVFTNLLDWNDRSTCVLFGDGAGAVVLKYSDYSGILTDCLYSDGRYHDILHVPGSIRNGTLINGSGMVEMDGKSVFKFAVNSLYEAANKVLDIAELSIQSVDWFIPHQANVRIIDALADKLCIQKQRFIVTLENCGNTSAASIPIALDIGYRDGRIKKGDLIMLLAVGGGMTWGATLLRF